MTCISVEAMETIKFDTHSIHHLVLHNWLMIWSRWRYKVEARKLCEWVAVWLECLKPRLTESEKQASGSELFSWVHENCIRRQLGENLSERCWSAWRSRRQSWKSVCVSERGKEERRGEEIRWANSFREQTHLTDYSLFSSRTFDEWKSGAEEKIHPRILF